MRSRISLHRTSQPRSLLRQLRWLQCIGFVERYHFRLVGQSMAVRLDLCPNGLVGLAGILSGTVHEVEENPATLDVTKKSVAETGTLTFKGDDRLSIAFFTETTAKIIVLATDGRVFSLDVSKLPSGRGYGEPLRLMAELGEDEDVATVLPYEEGGTVLVASTDGRGFVVSMSELTVGTRKGKSLMNPNAPAKAKLMVPADTIIAAAIRTIKTTVATQMIVVSARDAAPQASTLDQPQGDRQTPRRR